MEKAKRSKISLLKRILFPFLAVMILQAALFYCVVFESGSMENLKSNSFHIFNEKVSNRKNTLQSDMLGRWGNLKSTAEEIVIQVQENLIESGNNVEDLTAESNFGQRTLEKISNKVLEAANRNMVSGAFVVFEGDGNEKKCGLYLRDSDPAVTTADNSDLIALRGPSDITQKSRIALDRFWTPYFMIDKSDSDFAFYTKPFVEAQKHPEMEPMDLGYWSRPFYLNKNEKGDSDEIITFTMPLILDEKVFGILGIEISMDYLIEQMPYQELGEYGSYVLAVKKQQEDQAGKQDYEIIEISGVRARQLFSGGETISLTTDTVDGNFRELEVSQSYGKKVYFCVQPLQIYNTFTPFEGETWTLLGVVSDQNLLAFFYDFKESILVMIVISLLIGIAASLLVSRYVARPITLMTKKLKGIYPGQPVYLDKIQVLEIDELSDTIENLSKEVAGNADKLSAILAMTDTRMGACEYIRKFGGSVNYAGRFCELMGISEAESSIEVREVKEAFKNLLPYRVKEEDEREQGIYVFHRTGIEKPDWIRLRAVNREHKILIVATDITKDMEEKIKLRRERDYDILTGLYNRRAFYERMGRLYQEPSRLKTAAVLMMDLDNLKYVNDTYGHDYGDQYIRTAAEVLGGYQDVHTVIARLSGDEFLVFVYGSANETNIKAKAERIMEDFKEARIQCPDNTVIQVRVSAGMSFYPRDGISYTELIKFADFAMYMVKKTNKGRLAFFNQTIYDRESYLLQCKEELNNVIEDSLVDYMFQPILSAQDATVFAYEALMRPRTEKLKSPIELLTLARAQSQLHEIERMTFLKSLENFDRLDIEKENCCLFINSIANQHLEEEDVSFIEKKYQKYLSNVVVEITEEDKIDESMMNSKKRIIKKWNAKLAIDDFGTGYNSEAVLLSLQPHYVKFDRSLVELIDRDENKQKLLKNLVHYAKGQGIKTIAEGVETYGEMKVLILTGVDYLQGYYLARPSFIPPKPGTEVYRQIKELAKDLQNKGN